MSPNTTTRHTREQILELDAYDLKPLLEGYEPNFPSIEGDDDGVDKWVEETDYCINLYLASKNDYETQDFPFSVKAGWKYDSTFNSLGTLNQICEQAPPSPEQLAKIYTQIARLVLYTDFEILQHAMPWIDQIVRIAISEELDDGELEVRRLMQENQTLNYATSTAVIFSFGNTEAIFPSVAPDNFDQGNVYDLFDTQSDEIDTLLKQYGDDFRRNNLEERINIRVASISLLAQCIALSPVLELPKYSFLSESLKTNMKKLAQALPKPDEPYIPYSIKMATLTEIAKTYPLLDPQRQNLYDESMTEWIFAFVRYTETGKAYWIYQDDGEKLQYDTTVHDKLQRFESDLGENSIYNENIWNSLLDFIRFYQWDKRTPISMLELISRTDIICWKFQQDKSFDNLKAWREYIVDWKRYHITDPMKFSYPGHWWLVGHYGSLSGEISEFDFALTFDHAIAGAIRHLIRTRQLGESLSLYMHPLETSYKTACDEESAESYDRYIATMWAHLIRAGKIDVLINYFKDRLSSHKKKILQYRINKYD